MLTKIPLLKIESGFIAQRLAGIATVSFFEGDLDVVYKSIQEKFYTIVNLNPWLTGKLVQGKGDDVISLAYHKSSVSKDSFSRIFSNKPDHISITGTMEYAAILKAVHSLFIPSTNHMLNKGNRVTSLTLVKDSTDPKGKFALIFSLSHTVADGHTYYKILNMITAATEPKALSVARKHEADNDLIEAVGAKEFAFFHGASHIINALKTMIFSKKSSAFAYHVDARKVAEAKEKCTQTARLSTNDILSSCFSNITKARITSMAINFRKKIPSIFDNDAGNYEGVLMYDSTNYQQPEGIRKVLMGGLPYKGLAGKLPSFLSGVFCQMALISNWASFSKCAEIEGCKEVLHLPLIKKMPYEAAIIFRTHKQSKGIIFFSRKITSAQFEASNLPLGNTISNDIFIS